MSQTPTTPFPLANIEKPRDASGGEGGSFTERFTAISTSDSMTWPEKWAAYCAMSEKHWIEIHKPPLFVAALSLDSPETKLAQMEAALREGADPNEMDHWLDWRFNLGHPLTCCVNARGRLSHERVQRNLPAIELLLRHGADPRLRPYRGYKSALFCVRQGLTNTSWPEDEDRQKNILAFYAQAAKMIEEAAAALDRKDRNKTSAVRRWLSSCSAGFRAAMRRAWRKVRRTGVDRGPLTVPEPDGKTSSQVSTTSSYSTNE